MVRLTNSISTGLVVRAVFCLGFVLSLAIRRDFINNELTKNKEKNKKTNKQTKINTMN